MSLLTSRYKRVEATLAKCIRNALNSGLFEIIVK